MPISSSRGPWALALGALVLLPTGAVAHVRGAHKTLVLTAAPERLEGLLTLEYPAGPETEALWRSADRDGDATLDEAERQALQERLARTAMERLRIRLDGSELASRRAEVKLTASTRTGTVALSLLLQWTWPTTKPQAWVLDVSAAPFQGHSLEVQLFDATRDVPLRPRKLQAPVRLTLAAARPAG